MVAVAVRALTAWGSLRKYAVVRREVHRLVVYRASGGMEGAHRHVVYRANQGMESRGQI